MRIIHPARTQGKKIVIVVGGGFGGLNAAKTLANRPDLFVLLIDQHNHHLFQPLLYQVATAGLNPSDIAVPIRSQFAEASNIEVHWGKVAKVDLQQKFVSNEVQDLNETVLLELEYDYLILACGASHSYFGHPEWEEFAPGLKTLEQATEIRRRILSAFERAENELDPVHQKALMTFVVVGGGPTGVELAGAIADISRTVLVNDFKRIDPRQTRVVLIEAGARVLAPFAESLSVRAKSDLETLGVEVLLSTRVENINADGVQAGTEFISAQSVFWAAGVQASSLGFVPPLSTDRAGRIAVSKDLSIAGYKDVFVIGDMASVETSPGKMVPGLAPAAIQEGIHAAQMIVASVESRSRTDFRYLDKGQMATIGKRRAVAQVGKLKIAGWLAWMAWLFVHLLYLVGFKNRIFVLLQWTWNYIFSKRGSRLITDKNWRIENKNESKK